MWLHLKVRLLNLASNIRQGRKWLNDKHTSLFCLFINGANVTATQAKGTPSFTLKYKVRIEVTATDQYSDDSNLKEGKKGVLPTNLSLELKHQAVTTPLAYYIKELS
jgi:hypothetical protein